MRKHHFVFLLAAVLVLAAGTAEARRAKAPTEPGTYVDWNEDLDHVEIVETFAFGDYDRLVVMPFDVAGVPLPEADDNTYEPVQRVLSDIDAPLATGLREALEGFPVEVQGGGGAPADSGVLLLRGKVEELDPGSRAARYWGGFGAGAARAKLSGEVVDAASGRVLLRFVQERRSGTGMGGGAYENLLQRSLRAIGEDLGNGLRQF